MKFNTRSTDISEWHRWFAWRPVKIRHAKVKYDYGTVIYACWVWFEWIERKYSFWPEYREIKT
jgi:hypothetical protein